MFLTADLFKTNGQGQRIGKTFEWQLIGCEWHELASDTRHRVVREIERITGCTMARIRCGKEVVDSTPHVQRLTPEEEKRVREEMQLAPPASGMEGEIRMIESDRPKPVVLDFLREIQRTAAGLKKENEAR